VPDGNRTVSSASSIPRGQLFTLVYAYVIRHSLTRSAATDLMSLLNSLLPGCLPETMYYFSQILESSYSLDTYIYCCSCETFIGKYDKLVTKVLCPGCGKDLCVDDMIKCGCFFMIYPLENSLRQLLEDQQLGDQLLENNSYSSNRDCRLLSDISDGSEFQRKNTTGFPTSLSLTCNIDGVPVFRSSNTSIWPVYYTLNNLPFEQRRSNILLHGIWSGSGKPNMDCFLTPVVDELVALHEQKLVWKTKTGVELKTCVNFDLLVCDSVARSPLQKIKQFNGECGCSFCLHTGTVLQKGHGFVRTYPLEVNVPESRTHEQTLQFAVEADSKNVAVCGVKGLSILYAVPGFDIILGFNPECMHSVMLGVVRQFVGLWLD